MIEIKSLTKVYKKRNKITARALDDINLSLEEKGMIFLLGKSGSGKSTLLNVLGGLDKYDSGEVIVKGKSLSDFTQLDLDGYRNTSIGFIFHEYNILNGFTIGENICLALELQGKKATQEEVKEILKQVELDGFEDKKPNELSAGQLQKVAIARALIKNAHIIMADEPTGILDRNTGRQVLETLKKLSKDRLVLITTRDKEFAEKYGDRVIEIADGKIVRDTSYAVDESEKRVSKNKIQEQLSSKHYLSEDVKLIPSKLPVKKAVKTGASSLRAKPVRLLITILLCSFAFTIFGVADAIAAYNRDDTLVNSIVEQKVNYVSIGKQVRKAVDAAMFREENLNDNDVNWVKNELPYLSFICIYTPQTELLIGNLNDENGLALNGGYYTRKVSGFAEVSSDDIKQLGYTLLAGRMAKNADEVVITKYIYEHYKQAGYKNPDNLNDVSTIYSENDILDKKIDVGGKTFIICGVLDTAFNNTRYLKFKDFNYKNKSDKLFDSDSSLKQELEIILRKGPHSVLYVAEGFAKSNDISNSNPYGYLISKMPDDKGKIKGIVEFVNDTEENQSVQYTLYNEVANSLGFVSGVVLVSAVLSLYIGIGLTILGTVLLMSFIVASISYKKQEIRILRAMGARRSAVFLIFLAESSIIAVINGIVGFVLSWMFVEHINNMIMTKFNLPLMLFDVGLRQLGLIFIISIGVTIISSIFPLFKVARMR